MNRFTFITLVMVMALLFWQAPKLNAQENIGGTPISFVQAVKQAEFQSVELQKPDLSGVAQEDELRTKNGYFHRVGVSVQVNKDMTNSGTWTETADKGRIWRLELNCADALAIGVYYSQFYLPHGSKLFLYSSDHKHIIGAYTEFNNPESGLFATELVKGDEVILEYYEPYRRIADQPRISISEIAYVYRDAYMFSDTKDFGDADYCEVNINCSEGSSWQNQKKGVARLFLKAGSSYGWCSGTLVNNINSNCTPYFLTADHCGESSSTADLLQWVFYFNYEAPTCSNPSSAPSYNSKTGCILRAHGGDGGSTGSDFFLVEFSTAISTAWDIYFNGWDRNNTASSSGVSIHHPAGDIKKISTYTTTLVSSTWGGTVSNTHWRVRWAATTNGNGVTEGGSSGSPLFNSAGLVCGDLTGGGSYCSTPTQYDYYGKFSYSWESNGSTAAERLRDWLDPANSVTTLAGRGPCTSGAPVANFVASATNILVGSSINFTDLSTNSPTSWSWVFSGGTPGTSTVQNPTNITYNTVGSYTVTLTATNGFGSDGETKTAYINVTSGGTGTCDTVGEPLSGTPVLYSSQGGGYVNGNNVYGDLAKAEYFATYSPYNKINGIMFWFGFASGSGNAQAAVWNQSGGQPGTTFATANVSIPSIISDINNNYYTYVAFATPASIPGPFYAGVILPTTTGDTVALVSNTDGDVAVCNAWEKFSNGTWYPYTDVASWELDIRIAIFPHLCQVVSGDFEYNLLSDAVKIYPNPASDEAIVTFGDQLLTNVKIEVMNVLGKVVAETQYNDAATNLMRIDLRNVSPGNYFVRIIAKDNIVVKNLNVVR